MEIIDREAIFTGTVAQFLGLADAFDARRYSEGVLRIHDTRVKVWPAGQTPGHDGFIDCVELPENRTLLVCWAAPEDWAVIEPYWLELVAELRRLGCIEDAPAAVTGPNRRPGRPSPSLQMKLKIWEGWQEVRGRQSQEHYCQLLNPPIRPRTLRNYRDDLIRAGMIEEAET